MRRVLTAILATVLLVAPMTAAPGPDNSKPQATKVKPFQVGTASWYGKQFNGRQTASGEPYDMFLFTAAHRTLPLGSWVKVTNLANGNSVVVRINDRGPVPRNRIIDLSYGAAQILGVRARGVAKVRLDLIQGAQQEEILARNMATR